jgi:hypothetical protein
VTRLLRALLCACVAGHPLACGQVAGETSRDASVADVRDTHTDSGRDVSASSDARTTQADGKVGDVVLPADGGTDAYRAPQDASDALRSADAAVDVRGEASADAGMDGPIAPQVLAKCLQFCTLIQSSFPQCAFLIGTSSCSSWCGENADAAAGPCGPVMLTDLQCEVAPGNLQGCDGGMGFTIPACVGDSNSVRECLHGL